MPLGDRVGIHDHDGVDLRSLREEQVDRPPQGAALPGGGGILVSKTVTPHDRASAAVSSVQLSATTTTSYSSAG